MTPYPLTIYYDASCPLCRAEIDTLKSADVHGRLQLIDCSAAGFVDRWADRENLTGEDLMQALHVRDANGHWHVAVDAFVQLYTAVGLESIARVWAMPRLRPLWDWLYPRVVSNRRWLARLRLDHLLQWMLSRAARRSATRSAGCRSCDNLPE